MFNNMKRNMSVPETSGFIIRRPQYHNTNEAEKTL